MAKATNKKAQAKKRVKAGKPPAYARTKSTARARRGRPSSPCFMIETNNGGRLEAVPGFDGARVLAQGMGSSLVPAPFRTPGLYTAAHLEYAFPQSGSGTDDRAYVSDTTAIPWRCIAQLIIEGLHNRLLLGTAWLVSRSCLLTAGHNLFSAALGAPAQKIWIFPGRNGDAAPFGQFTSERFVVSDRWRAANDPDYDYGLIYLDQPIGDRLGWFGMAARSDAQLGDLILNNAGYPNDKPTGTLWFNAGRATEIDERTIVYSLDTAQGQSGSPIFYKDAQGNRSAVAIHAYGGSQNRGIRITAEVFNTVRAWINAA